MLCKEPAITLLILIIAYDYSQTLKFKKIFSDINKYMPYFILALLYLALRYNALGGFAPSKQYSKLTNYELVINAFALFQEFLTKLIIPINLNVFHDFKPLNSIFSTSGIISFAAITAFIIAIYFARKNKILFLSLIMILVPLLPALYIPGIGKNPFAERYLYLPSAGFAILISLLIGYSFSKKHYVNILNVLLLVVALTFFGGTFSRNYVWKSDLTLWTDTVKKSPYNAWVHEYYGYALYVNGQVDEAVKEYHDSIKTDNSIPDAHINLGVAYFTKGLIDEAIKEFLKTIEIKPDFVEAHDYLGRAYEQKGLTEKAFIEYKKSIEIDNNYSEGHYQVGRIYFINRDPERALNEFNIALKINPLNKLYQDTVNELMQVYPAIAEKNPFPE
ncbi:MAG: tetratricopeptide repeat protein [Candidatus Schekmanbacteria bacterium]|nr:tetratricopeptide repeat protein [Candidatus Schekmanbacteria bacterium]